MRGQPGIDSSTIRRRGGGTGITVVVRRVLRALVALPRQIVALARGSAGGSAPIGLALALVANAAALVLVFALARAIYYPFWAAGAPPRSWNGPGGGTSAVGATLVHWLVAIAVIVATYLVILVVERRASEAP